jgi:drug/metabolite transporter (DMT)-like permease
LIVALVLLSALLHASWNALLRLETDKDRALAAAVTVAALVAAVVAGVRWGLGQQPFASVESFGWTIGAGVCEWLYFASLAKALDRGALGPVYTITRGGAILLVWPISIALFAESLTFAPALGSAIVFGGLALSSVGISGARKSDRAALAWAIACATSIAGYHLAYKAALQGGSSASAVFAVGLGVATAINIGRIGAEGRRVISVLVRTRLARIVVMGVICSGSFLILLEALVGGGAGFVLTLRNTSVLFAVGLAFAIGERPRRSEIFGAALVAAGAILMSWPA